MPAPARVSSSTSRSGKACQIGSPIGSITSTPISPAAMSTSKASGGCCSGCTSASCWTTTPWTLLSNVAVAVHPGLEYGEYAVGDRRLILATSQASLPSSAQRGAPSFSELGAVRTFRGAELVGQRYRRPLEVVPLADDRVSRVVVAAHFVSAEDGSGLVHLAPAFGADDFQAGPRMTAFTRLVTKA